MTRKPIKLYIEDSGVNPPSSTTVDFERRPVLFAPDGTPLVRPAGFAPPKET